VNTRSGPDFTVVGAGLAGSLMACYLARAGYQVHVLERRSDPRLTGGGEGRSINLAISARGLDALDQVGLKEQVLSMAVPMRGRMMHSEDGRLTFQRYGTRETDVINSVSRAGLNTLLLDAAGAAGNVTMEFDTRVLDVDPESGVLDVVVGESQAVTSREAGVVVGADGAFSSIRTRLHRLDRFDYRQDYLEYGYKELSIPAGGSGEFQMEPNALHIWPRGGAMMIGLPNPDGSFTCTLFWPLDGPLSFSALKSATNVREFFSTHYADAVPHMPRLGFEYLENATSSLVTVRCGPWSHEDRIVLIGDAAHAVVPFYGQGANAAFADCPVLTRCIESHRGDLARAFHEYYVGRKRHLDVLAELAIANFVEMRDHVSSPMFRGKKRLERILHRVFPAWFVPLYSMVSFSLVPYGDAVRRAWRQQLVVRTLGVGLLLVILAGAMWLWS